MARIAGYASLTPSRTRREGGGVEQPRIVFVIFDGFQPLDLTGPHEVFSSACAHGGDYACEIVARHAGPVTSRSGLPVNAGAGIGGTDPGGIDTLVVAGGSGVDAACADADLTG